jgi:hypothetical protein
MMSEKVNGLINTSVEDMQSGLWQYGAKDLEFLRAALLAVTRRGDKTKAKILGVKIRKIEKDAEKERKLRLIQKAYD